MSSSSLIGVDIGGTKVQASLCRREGILARIRERTIRTGKKTALPLQVLSLIGKLIRRTGTDKGDIAGVGISTAGPFRKSGGMTTLVSPNLCGGLAGPGSVLNNDWAEIPLERYLTGKYGRLEIDNDAVAGAVAERLFGAGKGYDNMIYVTWSTGIGTGAFVDGRLIRGKNGNAPHGGHIYLTEDGPRCGCGNFGHFEALASGTAIALAYGGRADAKEVFEAYGRGDQRAAEVISTAAGHFGRGLASLNAVLDTKLFVIGGSVYLNNREILGPIVEEIFFSSFPVLSEGVEIKASGLDAHLPDLAGISLVLPEGWIEEWEEEEPWREAPDPPCSNMGTE